MHAWEAYTATVGRNKIMRRREINQVLRCTRCATLKTRVMTTSGELLRNSYSYPEGYLLKQHGPMTPADREWIRTRNLARAFELTEVEPS